MPHAPLTRSLKLPAKAATSTACPRRRSRQGIRPWQRARSPVTIKREQPFQGHDMGGHPPRPDGPGGRRHVAGARTHDPPPRRIRGLGHRGSGGADLDQPLGGPASARSAQEDDPIAVTVRRQPSVPPTCLVGGNRRRTPGNSGEDARNALVGVSPGRLTTGYAIFQTGDTARSPGRSVAPAQLGSRSEGDCGPRYVRCMMIR